MAVTTLYFSDSGAGAADGTSWANRAAFVSAGTVNALITGFDFTSNSLLAYVEGGKSYTISTAPAVTNSSSFTLTYHGCDSSGNPLEPPDPDWTSDQPEFDTTTFPVFAATTNILICNSTHTYFRCVKLTGSGNTSNGLVGSSVQSLDWCAVECSSALTSANGVAVCVKITNSWTKCTNATYSVVCASNDIANVRIVGNASASSGTRKGWLPAGGTVRANRVTSINNVGGNFMPGSTSTSFTFVVTNCVGYGGSAGNIVLPGTASMTTHSRITGCVLADNGAYGVDFGTNSTPTHVSGNAVFDNTSGQFGNAGSINTAHNVTSGAAADEFVDSAGGDFRIKNTSSLWGKGYGVSDQPAAAGGGGLLTHPGMSGRV